MADLMSGPNAPLTRAFIFCGWRCITIDWLINPQHDLAHPEFQQELHEMLQQADCICATVAPSPALERFPGSSRTADPLRNPCGQTNTPQAFHTSEGVTFGE